MNAHLNEQLSAYLDGDLAGEELARAEAHLAACAECRAELEGLRRLVRRAAALDDRPPERDLWTGIAARLHTPSSADVLPFAPRKRRLAFTMPQLAAAAVALITISSGAGVVLTRGRAAAGTYASGPDSATARTVVDARPADVTLAGYDSIMAGMEELLRTRRGELDTATVRVVEQSLAVMDVAIRQVRNALARDPNNRYLNGHLQRALDRKLGLLRQAATLPAASS